MMRPLRSFFKGTVDEQEYTPLSREPRLRSSRTSSNGDNNVVPFSWVEYGIFALLGMAMLWAWNMFLAASPYFQGRFGGDEWVLQNFQSAIIAVSTVTNFGVMIILTKFQYTGLYAFRIKLALYINVFVFALLTVSTTAFLDVSPGQYLSFILVVVASTAWAACLIQNGAFALTASLGRPEYMQAIMAGQGVAGVLPPVAQIILVLMAPPEEPVAGSGRSANHNTGNVAFTYFLTAVVVSVVAFLAFIPLARRYTQITEDNIAEHRPAFPDGVHGAESNTRKVATITTLFEKVFWCAAAIFLCFTIAMFYPVLTPKIVSIAPPSEANALQEPTAFIPLAIFFWQLGDLTGRASALSLPFRGHPSLLFVLGIARVLFLPLYALCNVHGRGAVIPSDLFYLLFVQFPYGLTNGWLASNCMMTACEWVEEGEREATGGFMAMCLMAGLTFGSLLSFTVAGI